MKINGYVHDLTPELYKVLSSISYFGKTMKNDTDLLKMDNI